MSSYDLRKHLNQRVSIRMQNKPGAMLGVVKFIDGTSLRLWTLVSPPGRDILQSKVLEIPCERIVSILPDKWQ